ncbi:MAG: carbohydrate ABC transporter permease [Actinomycetia bacterium]|nr:carbohydrate ABC transporter permease [Actinomycetes bacterium]
MTNLKARYIGFRILLYVLIAIIVLWVLAPFAWMVISSISTRADLLEKPLGWIPEKINLDGYKKIILGGSMATRAAREFKGTAFNSFLVSVFATLISIGFGSMAAYSFSRLRSRGMRLTFTIMMLSYMLPPISLAIPLYILLSKLQILDNIGTLVFVYCSFNLPLATWFMKEFFDGIPVDLEEAAQIDGCSRLKSLWKIVMPLSAPGIASTAIFIFVISWNEFFFALLYTTTMASKTLPVLVGEFSSKFTTDFSMMATAGVLASIIPIALALFFQKYIIQGLTAGGVKE